MMPHGRFVVIVGEALGVARDLQSSVVHKKYVSKGILVMTVL